MGNTVDKSALFAPRLPEADVEIPGVGTVRVRALTRAEVMRARRIGQDDPAVLEQQMLSAGMVDPVMSATDVQRWQEAAPADELSPVTDAILGLSGLADKAAKDAYADFRHES